MEKLPQDVKLDIFSRLPAESILEYKQVCKSWLSLLEDPSFPQIHLHRQLFLLHYNNNNNTPDGNSTTTTTPVEFGFILLTYTHEFELLYGKYDEKEQSYKIVKNINYPPMETTVGIKAILIIASCNGLVCLSRTSGNEIGDPNCIFNPITREYVNLPRLFGGKIYLKGHCRIMNGFGYNPSTNEYKVVRIIYPDHKENLGQVQVYTLGAAARSGSGSGSGWRDKGQVSYPFTSTTATHANGKLYWLNEEENIVAFDLADEVFNIIPSPPIVVCFDSQKDKYGVYSRPLCVLGGLLGIAHCVSSSETGSSSSHEDIWLLKKKSSRIGDEQEHHECWSWSKEFTIPFINDIDDVCVLALTKRGELLFWDSEYSLCRYDPKSARIEILHLDDGKCINAIPHINSFVSMKAAC